MVKTPLTFDPTLFGPLMLVSTVQAAADADDAGMTATADPIPKTINAIATLAISSRDFMALLVPLLVSMTTH
ncbi:hypothetical protein [Glycomyces sp. MUSA5-2]|uniref:hypothetical protein n=1 Tax=Glycomyces sp. MUSA5-2 TaxID=2053002 RepID=UPI003008AB6A